MRRTMPAPNGIRWVYPYQTSRSASLPPRQQAAPRPTADAKRPAARLPNPRQEVVSGAKLRDALRW